MTRLEEFTNTGFNTCRRHGRHHRWVYRLYKQTMECSECLKERSAQHRKEHPEYQDNYRFSYEGCLTRILAQARNRAKKKNLKIDINKQWLKEQLKIQNNKCAYTGVEFSFSREFSGSHRFYLPSIDQVVPGGGYTKDNCVVVLAVINKMKWEIPLNIFKELCAKVSDYK